MLRFGCPTCNSVIDALDHQANTKIACPKCGQRLLVPKPAHPPPVDKTVLGMDLSAGKVPPARAAAGRGDPLPTQLANVAQSAPAGQTGPQSAIQRGRSPMHRLFLYGSLATAALLLLVCGGLAGYFAAKMDWPFAKNSEAQQAAGDTKGGKTPASPSGTTKNGIGNTAATPTGTSKAPVAPTDPGKKENNPDQQKKEKNPDQQKKEKNPAPEVPALSIDQPLVFPKQSPYATKIAVLPGGRQFLALDENKLVEWDIESLKVTRTFAKYPVPIYHNLLALTPDRSLAMTLMLNCDYAEVWDVATARVVSKIEGIPDVGRVTAAALSADKKHALVSSHIPTGDGKVPRFGLRFWGLDPVKELGRAQDKTFGYVQHCFLLPDNRTALVITSVANAEQNGFYIVDLESGKVVNQFAADAAGGVVVSADGRYLACSKNMGNGHWRSTLWDLKTVVDEPRPKAGGILPGPAMAVSAGGKYLACQSKGTSVSVFNSSDFEETCKFRWFTEGGGHCYCMDFSPTNQYLLVGDYERIRLWPLIPDKGGRFKSFAIP
jgi:hypothetical protein